MGQQSVSLHTGEHDVGYGGGRGGRGRRGGRGQRLQRREAAAARHRVAAAPGPARALRTRHGLHTDRGSTHKNNH